MAIRVQNNQGKILGQDSIHSMPHFVNSPRLNLHEQQLSQTLSKNESLRVESPSRCYDEVNNLDLQLEDQSSPSPQSSSQSRCGVSVVEKSKSQVQCISSESVQNENSGKHVEEQVKPAFLVSNMEFSAHPSQVELCQSPFPSQAQVPYVYSDPYFGSLYSAYGPQAIIQPQMMGIASAHIPLPPELAQDGPIDVNAKQYNGILRWRQMRAKLEAQNKLVKGRKPYLHESRHQHALNRVRGSGGRFLSTRKQQQSGPAASTDSLSASVHSHQERNVLEIEAERFEDNRHNASTNSSSAAMGYTHGDLIFQQRDDSFMIVSHQMAVSMPGVVEGVMHY